MAPPKWKESIGNSEQISGRHIREDYGRESLREALVKCGRSGKKNTIYILNEFERMEYRLFLFSLRYGGTYISPQHGPAPICGGFFRDSRAPVEAFYVVGTNHSAPRPRELQRPSTHWKRVCDLIFMMGYRESAKEMLSSRLTCFCFHRTGTSS